MADNDKPRPLSEDEVELFKKQRELSLPSARVLALDDFAKWMFTVVTLVGTLGAAFSNSSFQKLSSAALLVFSVAIGLSGLSLALAVILRAIEPSDVNWNSLWDILNKTESTLRLKSALAWISGGLFAIALILAGLSPVISTRYPDVTHANKNLNYSLGKDGVHVTATLVRPTGAWGQIEIFASSSKGTKSLIAAQRSDADANGVTKFDISSTAIPADTQAITVLVACDGQKGGEVLFPIESKENQDVNTNNFGPCFQ